MAIHIDRLLETCVKQNGSDLHLHVGRPPIIRVHGRLRTLKTQVLEPADTVALMKSITPERCQHELQEEGGSDFGFAFGDKGRFRVSIFKQRGNVSLTLRLIPSRLMTLEEIGVPLIIKDLLRRPRGLFLVTGPTGSGKTTTLASMINYINERLDRHIITVEDPVEYYHPHKKSMVNQREVGVDVPSFGEALRRVLRMDPDVILVGELRDLETMESAVRAAETGHLVFGTVHTTGAQGTINRIIDAFPVDQQEQMRVQLSTSLIAVLSQMLLPNKKHGGRIGAFEFLVITPAIANLIRENKTFRIDSSIQTGKRYGMQLLDDHLWDIYHQGLVTLEDMMDVARSPGAMQERLDRHQSGLGDAPMADDEESDEQSGRPTK